MAIRINGKDMKDAVIKTTQYEMRISELMPDHMNITVTDISGESFSFVPRFLQIAYPDSKVINVKDTGVMVIRAKQSVSATAEFAEKLRMEVLMSFTLLYSRRRLAEITIE